MYQLLLLSAKGARAPVLRGICDYFQHPAEGDARDAMTQMQATAILHIDFALKQDSELGREFLKLLKGSHSPLTAFSVAVLLSMAKISRFQQLVFDFLKQEVLKRVRDEPKSYSKWARPFFRSSLPIGEVFLQVARNSGEAWDYLLQPLVDFGVFLMDCTAKDAGVGKARQLGSAILSEVFQLHFEVRSIVLEQIFTRIAIGAETVKSYVELLSIVIEKTAYNLMPQLAKIKEAFEYLSFLTPDVARALLNAVQPLLEFNHSFRDYAVLVLKKSLFSRDLDGRLTAVHGLMQILAQSSARDAPRDAPRDARNTQRDSALPSELIGLLQRCLKQQPEVRQSLYRGLPGVLKADSSLHVAIFEMLFAQFELCFVENEESFPPFNLKRCVVRGPTNAQLSEPFHWLLDCIVKCLHVHRKHALRAATQASAGAAERLHNEHAERLRVMLGDMLRRLNANDLEDYKFDKGTEFTYSTVEGQFNILAAELLLGVLEVMIEHSLQEFNANTLDAACNLHRAHLTLAAAVRANTLPAKNLKNKPIPMEPPTLGRSLAKALIASLAEAKRADASGDQQTFQESLREKIALRRFVLQRCLAHLQRIESTPLDSDELGVDMQYCSKIAKYLLVEFEHWHEEKDTKETATGKSLPTLALQCVQICIDTLTRGVDLSNVQRVAEMSAFVLGENANADTLLTADAANALSGHLCVLEERAALLITDPNKEWQSAEILASVVARLCEFLPPDNLQPHQQWADGVSRLKVEQIGFVRVALAHLLSLNRIGGGQAHMHLAVEARRICGALIEPDEGEAEVYLCVNSKTVASVLAMLTADFERRLAEAETIFTTIIEGWLPDDDEKSESDENRHTGALKRATSMLNEILAFLHSLFDVYPYRGDKSDINTNKMLQCAVKAYRLLITLIKFVIRFRFSFFVVRNS